MINSTIGKYKITRLIGEGGMAKVFLAHDKKFDSHVAIKFLNKEFINNQNIRKRFLAEAKNMFRMSHPNIIKVTDLIEEEDTVAFVMEYVEGETLKDYLERKGKLSDNEITSLFTQMLDAVGYVHSQQLVHRDIKPSNFMLDKKGKVKLLDFGIAKTTDATSAEYTQTGTGVQMGTPMYMSPEQVKSTKEVTFASDIYSLGVVLWQMVAGRKPYDTNELSSAEIQVSILKETLPSLNTVWDAIIQKATAKNRDERFQNCNAWLSEMNNTTTAQSSAPVGDDKTVIENKITVDATQVDQQAKNTTNTSSQASKEPNVNKTEKSKSYRWLLILIIPIGMFIKHITSEDSFTSVTDTDVDSTAVNPVDSIPSTTIGTQVWMAENLNVSTFRNGDPIPEAKTEEEWKKAGENQKPAWCYYNNDPANGTNYGKLYNWYAVNDPRGLAPAGYHIPTDSEWMVLTDFLGGKDNAGTKMKSKTGWNNGGNGTNESGFNGLPGGYRNYSGTFGDVGDLGLWWSSAEDETYYAWGRYLVYSGGNVLRDDYSKGLGLSVRCLRD